MKKNLHLFTIVLAMCVSFVGCDLGITTENAITSEKSSTRSITSIDGNIDPGVMLHAYMWTFADIEAALPEIAAAGYTSIQTSPIQPTKEDTDEWWVLYQPCDFSIGNYQLGTEDEFKSLCSSAEEYGIYIIVDAVLNHVADNGSDGEWSDQVADYLQDSSLYHNNGSCSNYSSRENLTQDNLGNLPDLNTQSTTVQGYVIDFLNQCIADGADGFRFDAAKHIETNEGDDAYASWSGDFWENVLNSLDSENLYLFGEVLPDTGDNDEIYTTYFDITGHGYIDTLEYAVDNKNLSSIGTIWHYDHELDPTSAVVYTENHDTYEDDTTSGYSYYTRKMGNAIIISRANVTPRVFDRQDEDLWNDDDIVAINKFHNSMEGTSEYIRYPETDMILIDRGTIGTAIINVGEETYLSSDTNLEDGTYSNQATESATLTASNGTLYGTVPGYSIVILYNSDDSTDTSTDDTTSTYPSMYIRGSMNSWGSTEMTLASDNTWTVTVNLTADTTYSYKYDAYADWSTNWGDNNADYYADQEGDNITYTPSISGTYTFSFNDSTFVYSTTAQDITVDDTTENTETSSDVETIFNIHYDTGVGSCITLRGDTEPLSWSEGLDTEWTSGNVWTITITTIEEGATVEYKPLIDDSTWASGDNYSITGGSEVDIYPTF